MNEHPEPPGVGAGVPLLKVPEAARRLTICERKLWGLTAPRGPIPCVRIGRGIFYSPADLDEFVRHEFVRRSTESMRAA